jgi:hypothetical protein
MEHMFSVCPWAAVTGFALKGPAGRNSLKTVRATQKLERAEGTHMLRPAFPFGP